MNRVQRPYLRARRHSTIRPEPWVAGVCSGAAFHLQVPVWAVRLVAAGGAALAGAGVLLYVWLWAFIPKEGSARALADRIELGTDGLPLVPQPRKKREPWPVNRQLLLIGAASLAVAALLSAGPVLFGLHWATLVWWTFLLGGIGLVWSQVPRLSGLELNQAMGLIVVGVVLIVWGAVRLLLEYDAGWAVDLSLGVGLVVLAAIMVALAPVAIKLVGDLTSAKTREAREAERASIAAHLHDSVLQTLTLIKAGAEDPARVRSLALSQERELREWLYSPSQTPVEHSAAGALRAQASSVEAAHGVAIEVVTVGDCTPGSPELTAIAAAGEAMTNAARHGAPPISVFQEVRGSFLEIFVKDAGRGFDESKIPPDRHGFRHSIRGRVETAGGSVEVRRRGGTEIRIAIGRESKGEQP